MRKRERRRAERWRELSAGADGGGDGSGELEGSGVSLVAKLLEGCFETRGPPVALVTLSRQAVGGFFG